jgi:hypothetical protein
VARHGRTATTNDLGELDVRRNSTCNGPALLASKLLSIVSALNTQLDYALESANESESHHAIVHDSVWEKLLIDNFLWSGIRDLKRCTAADWKARRWLCKKSLLPGIPP